jgi:hypothetical protein
MMTRLALERTHTAILSRTLARTLCPKPFLRHNAVQSTDTTLDALRGWLGTGTSTAQIGFVNLSNLAARSCV